MKKTAIVFGWLLLSMGIANKTYAQYYFYNDNFYDSPIMFEVGASVGVMNCLTDLGGQKGLGQRFVKDLNMGKSQMNGSIFISGLYKNAIGARLEATFGKLAADDAVLKNVPVSDIAHARYNRNLNFETPITEFSFVTEIHPFFILKDWEQSETYPPRISPYIMGGIGYFSYNPKGRLGDQLIELQPLHTEGQGFVEYPDRKEYKLKQINIPVGVGFKYELSPSVNLRAEFVYRILSTDYLDDCSTKYIDPSTFATNGLTGDMLYNAVALYDRQLDYKAGPGGKRGNSTNNDGYFSFNIKAGITFGRDRVR
jgi:hypothetical protein